MKIACTMASDRGGTDLLLYALAHRLVQRGVRLAGTVQINTDRHDGGPCDMDVEVLPHGPVVRISQWLGLGSRGCRLDLEALERVVGLTDIRIVEGADVLIINKFGKHEAEGRGFRNTIAAAFARNIPVLVGLNQLNATAFDAFTEGCATRLEPETRILEAWAREALGIDMPDS